VFLDNLPLHHNLKLKQLANSLKVEFIFNAPSSCELNPIERLWAWSKQNFKRECIQESNFKNENVVWSLIEKSILESPPIMQKKYVQTCL